VSSVLSDDMTNPILSILVIKPLPEVVYRGQSQLVWQLFSGRATVIVVRRVMTGSNYALEVGVV